METMIERVARALCFEDRGHDDDWRLYQDGAFAAIRTMREPTKAMLAATEDVVVGHDDFACGDGALYLSYAGSNGSDGFYDYAIAAHQAMIDAALKETT